MIRPGFWRWLSAVALGVLLALWLCGGDREAEALGSFPDVGVLLHGDQVSAGWSLIAHGAGHVRRLRPVAVTQRRAAMEDVGTVAAIADSLLRAERIGVAGSEQGVKVHARSVARVRPDPTLTPGVTRTLTRQQICDTKWGKDRRAVTLTMRHHVFAAYGIPYAQHALYEVDHLIPRELGGADDERNLWPEKWDGPDGAHAKDRLENSLHRAVCRGDLTLESAQSIIRSDWLAAARVWVR